MEEILEIPELVEQLAGMLGPLEADLLADAFRGTGKTLSEWPVVLEEVQRQRERAVGNVFCAEHRRAWTRKDGRLVPPLNVMRTVPDRAIQYSMRRVCWEAGDAPKTLAVNLGDNWFGRGERTEDQYIKIGEARVGRHKQNKTAVSVCGPDAAGWGLGCIVFNRGCTFSRPTSHKAMAIPLALDVLLQLSATRRLAPPPKGVYDWGKRPGTLEVIALRTLLSVGATQAVDDVLTPEALDLVLALPVHEMLNPGCARYERPTTAHVPEENIDRVFALLWVTPWTCMPGITSTVAWVLGVVMRLGGTTGVRYMLDLFVHRPRDAPQLSPPAGLVVRDIQRRLRENDHTSTPSLPRCLVDAAAVLGTDFLDVAADTGFPVHAALYTAPEPVSNPMTDAEWALVARNELTEAERVSCMWWWLVRAVHQREWERIAHAFACFSDAARTICNDMGEHLIEWAVAGQSPNTLRLVASLRRPAPVDGFFIAKEIASFVVCNGGTPAVELLDDCGVDLDYGRRARGQDRGWLRVHGAWLRFARMSARPHIQEICSRFPAHL